MCMSSSWCNPIQYIQVSPAANMMHKLTHAHANRIHAWVRTCWAFEFSLCHLHQQLIHSEKIWEMVLKVWEIFLSKRGQNCFYVTRGAGTWVMRARRRSPCQHHRTLRPPACVCVSTCVRMRVYMQICMYMLPKKMIYACKCFISTFGDVHTFYMHK
jgi:hypothetical protein